MKKSSIRLLALIICIFTTLYMVPSCNYNAKKDIVGKWYNSSGKCLDIRSDGTYKMENEYGSGTWKYLDDNETIEFKDHLGSTIEIKVGHDDKGKYIDLGYWGKFYNSTDIKNKETTTNGISVSIEETSIFSEERAMIVYHKVTDPKTKYHALIDTKGNILYEVKDDNTSNSKVHYVNGNTYDAPLPFSGITSIGNDLIDKSGKIIWHSDSNVQLWGDGLVLTGGTRIEINGERNIFKILNKDGNELQETELVEAKEILGIYYAGCGIFQFKIKESDDKYASTKSLLWNSYTGKKKIIDNRGEQIEFIDNIAIYRIDSGNTFSSVDTDFNEKVMGKGDYISGGYLISHDEYINITNPKTNKTVKFIEYGAERVVDKIVIKNGKGMVNLKGKDGGVFFTVIDDNAKMLFDPISGYGEKISNDKICCQSGRNIKIINLNGEIISKFELNANGYVEELNDDILTIERDDGQRGFYYLNLKGEKLFEMLYP